MARREKISAKSVSELVGKVLEPVVARRAGMTLDLIGAWPEIVGPRYGKTTRPEKINWNRRADADDPFEPATLVVACESAIALFFQHDNDQVVEKINSFFGFDAIGRIKILQKPVGFERSAPKSSRVKPASLNAHDTEKLNAILEGVEDDELRKKLMRIGQGVLLRQKD